MKIIKMLAYRYLQLKIAFALLFFSSAVQAQEAAATADAENGGLLYYQHGCYGCHGFSGYGRMDLNNTGSAMMLNETIFSAFLRGREDIAPLLPSTNMPNYPENSLSDDNVSDIYAYIVSMPANSPEIGDVPTLQAILDSAERPYSP